MDSRLSNSVIEALEQKGLRRWTKGGLDRLYANAKDFGLACEYNKSGGVKSATLNGDPISNSKAGGHPDLHQNLGRCVHRRVV